MFRSNKENLLSGMARLSTASSTCPVDLLPAFRPVIRRGSNDFRVCCFVIGRPGGPHPRRAPGRAGRGGPDRLRAVVHRRQPRSGASRRCGRGGKTARIPMTKFLPALSRLFAFAGAEKARLRATTRTARQIFFWGVCLLSLNWDCLLLRPVRKDYSVVKRDRYSGD